MPGSNWVGGNPNATKPHSPHGCFKGQGVKHGRRKQRGKVVLCLNQSNGPSSSLFAKTSAGKWVAGFLLPYVIAEQLMALWGVEKSFFVLPGCLCLCDAYAFRCHRFCSLHLHFSLRLYVLFCNAHANPLPCGCTFCGPGRNLHRNIFGEPGSHCVANLRQPMLCRVGSVVSDMCISV